MKTENHQTVTTTNGDPAGCNRHAGFISIQVTSGLSRFPTACLRKWNELKERLNAQLAVEYGGAIDQTLLRQAINEADALAATTPFPNLFLPTLAEEKVQLAYAWSNHQRTIREKTMTFAE